MGWNGSRRDLRAYGRHSFEGGRSIAVRRLDDDRKPFGRWFLADIVDVGEGGMCLIASEEQSLEMGQWLLMDLRAHPGFGMLRLQAELRWLTRAHFALTFGVAFATPLKEVPVLSLERRNLRRDPNQEDWALAEERELALS
ncbi:PilZ domain-containing protein [Synechococcus sp. CS-1332]|uniref:PilZ domain-containing protein n=1 Tax=Synechococcus sp. CS-1332 TaxID=2847972 RepID=UPI00223BC1A4|nr:PilZ domain-containing protein [Synechococcus sp. CS-1332]MCT0207280.1 PilZ domain-containing protein [Synechococcus sp. CS-1332]